MTLKWDSAYRAGRSSSWIKVKNLSHPAMERVKDFLEGSDRGQVQ
jgi:ATP-dependent DNA ligase